MAKPITSIAFSNGIMSVLFSNGQQDDWILAYVVGPVSTIIAPTPTSNVAGEVVSTTRPGLQAASMVLQYPGEDLPRAVVIDIRDVASPVYATAQDLADDITSNIPVGGGGGGTTTDVSSAGGSGISIIESGSGTDTVVLKRAVAGVGIGVYADTDGFRIENEGALEMVPFVIVTSGDIKAAYRYYDEYNSKPRYVQVIPGTTQADSAAASNFLWWITGDSKWHVWGNGGAEYYTSADAVATPDLVTTWVLASGATAPLPTVEPYYGTQQDLDEVLAGRSKCPLVYTAILNQSGTDAPVATGVYNTTGLMATFTYLGPGFYAIAMPGLPIGNRVKCFISNGNIPSFLATVYLDDGETIEILSGNALGVGADDKITNASIQIIIDP